MKKTSELKKFVLATSVLALGLGYSVPTKAAFEWTPPPPKAAVVVEKPSVTPTPVIEDTDMIPPPEEKSPVVVEEPSILTPEVDEVPAQTVTETPVELLEENVQIEVPVETKAPVKPAEDSVVQDLKEIIKEAEQNNNITPVEAIPQSEKIDQMPPSIEKVERRDVVTEPVKLTDPLPQAASAETNMPVASIQDKVNQDTVQGFGKDLPLITAIRQIVPQNTAYSFGENVDLGKPVSWTGGATWQDTISKIANENGLHANFTDQEVQILMNKPVSVAALDVKTEPVKNETVQNLENVPVQPQPLPEEAINHEMVDNTEAADAGVIAVQEQVTEPKNDDLKVVKVETEKTDIKEIVKTESIEVIEPKKSMQENEILEATINDAIIISPIEDMNSQVIALKEADADALTKIEEGAIIKPVEPQPITEVAEAEIASMPSMDTLESVSDIKEMPTNSSENNPVILEGPGQAEVKVEEIAVVEEQSVPQEPKVPTVVEIEPVKEIQVASQPEPESLKIEEAVDLKPEPVIENINEDVVASVITAQPPPEVDLPTPSNKVSEMVKDSNLGKIKTWKVKKNSDLKQTLEQWSKEAGIDLEWNMKQDYSVNYMVWVDGNFEEAVNVLMQGYSNDPGLIPSASITMGPEGRPILIVEPAA